MAVAVVNVAMKHTRDLLAEILLVVTKAGAESAKSRGALLARPLESSLVICMHLVVAPPSP
jgi:hypothetical protein